MSDNMKEAARIRDELFGIPNNEKRIDDFAAEIVAILKPMSDKEKVLARWPDAWCHFDKWDLGFVVEQDRGFNKPILGSGAIEDFAWADAARKLTGMSESNAERVQRLRWQHDESVDWEYKDRAWLIALAEERVMVEEHRLYIDPNFSMPDIWQVAHETAYADGADLSTAIRAVADKIKEGA